MSVPTTIIIDDNYTDSHCITDMLHEASYWVKATEDWRSLLRSMGISWPALILLDLMLPGLIGDEMLAQPRSGPYPGIPAVAPLSTLMPKRCSSTVRSLPAPSCFSRYIAHLCGPLVPNPSREPGTGQNTACHEISLCDSRGTNARSEDVG